MRKWPVYLTAAIALMQVVLLIFCLATGVSLQTTIFVGANAIIYTGLWLFVATIK